MLWRDLSEGTSEETRSQCARVRRAGWVLAAAVVLTLLLLRPY